MASKKDLLLTAATFGSTSDVDEAISEYKKHHNISDFKTKDVKDENGRTIAHYACLYNTEEVALHVLSMKWCNIADTHGAWPYMYAARRGFHQYLQQWSGKKEWAGRYQEDYGFYNKDQFDRSALHYCCGVAFDGKDSDEELQHLEDQNMLKVSQPDLIKCAEVLTYQLNQKDKNGAVPLQYAVKSCYGDMVEWLCLKNPKLPDPGKTVEACGWLLQLKFLYPDSLSETIEELFTIIKPSYEDAHSLLCKVCDLTVTCKTKTTEDNEENVKQTDQERRLHYAEIILQHLGDFIFKQEKNALSVTYSTGFDDMFKFFLDKKAKVTLKDEDCRYESILHWFIRTLFQKENSKPFSERAADMAKLVTQFKINVTVTDDRGMSPLHQLCGDTYETEPRSWISLRAALVEKVLQLGSNVNAEDAKGRTPLIVAMETGHFELIIPLLEAGADPLWMNKWGVTAMSLAKDADIVPILKQKAESMQEINDRKQVPPKTVRSDGTGATNIQEPHVSSDGSSLTTLEDLLNRVDHLFNSNTEFVQRIDDLAQHVDDLTKHMNGIPQRMDDLTKRLEDLTVMAQENTQKK